MKVSLVDVDGHNFPNLALMKLSAYHKMQGDTVDWYEPLFSHPDRIYASKVFTFTPDYIDYNVNDPAPECGGTGYDIAKKLPPEIDNLPPDYSIYPRVDYAIGFLSRGCVRSCQWCVVPKKEGTLRRYSDLALVSCGFDGQRRRDVVLMDNNFLANDADFVREQLDKSVRLRLRLDFNQGLDARLINPDNAAQLARVHWSNYIRFACDTQGVVEAVKSAISTLRSAGYKREFMIYFLARDVAETLDRVNQILAADQKIVPYVMPYCNLDGDGEIEDDELKHLARWCNRAWIRKTCNFEQYRRKQP